ncbi:hypothetical protein JJC04_15030 [Flavobacterium covae]|nr:hypothetical protein [Flavobacterium covae]QYS91094.1 hypothetical protein JJC04_15030 [Flavobacterium covae]
MPIEDVTLSSIISNIKTGTYHDSINAIRMAKGMGKPERADQLKKNFWRSRLQLLLKTAEKRVTHRLQRFRSS